mmetsp:Transcript_12142/g.31100  ORF Transcript_12142/g.31100 Transcript_12142/m.31100 type:complete len:135 (-) Transcript_12142:157-561(-)
MPSVDAADVLVAAIGGVVHFTWLLAANRRGFARVLTVLASWLWVWLPTGATLPKLPLSPSASAASGWPVVLMCWVGTELCLDARGLLRRRVKSAAAKSGLRVVVDLGAHYSARHMCQILCLIRSSPGAVGEIPA